MKKSFIVSSLFASLFALLPVQAVENRFAQGCQLTYAGINTVGQERALSLYKRNQIVFLRNDTAYVVAVSSESDLEPFFVASELEALPINDQFAYDGHYDEVIFSNNNGKLYHSYFKENHWLRQYTLKMEGVTGMIHGDYTDSVANPHVISKLFNPTFSNKGDRLYFAATSQGHTNRDIWYSDRGGTNGRWQAPHKLAGNVNTDANEDHPFVVGDTLLYFVTDRDAHRNLYYVDLRDPQQQAYVSVLSNPNTDESGIVVVDDRVHIISNRCSSNSDQTCDDNIFKAELPKRKLLSLPVSFNSDFDAMPVIFQPLSQAQLDSADKASQPVNHDLAAQQISKSDQVKADSVLRSALSTTEQNKSAVKISENVTKIANKYIFYFDTDRDTIRNSYAADFEELSKRLNQNSDRYIIIGFCDERGTAAYNQDLSVRRAQRVFENLVQKGINSSRLMFTGFGSRGLVVKNAKTDADNQLNRRVEIHLMK